MQESTNSDQLRRNKLDQSPERGQGNHARAHLKIDYSHPRDKGAGGRCAFVVAPDHSSSSLVASTFGHKTEKDGRAKSKKAKRSENPTPAFVLDPPPLFFLFLLVAILRFFDPHLLASLRFPSSFSSSPEIYGFRFLPRIWQSHGARRGGPGQGRRMRHGEEGSSPRRAFLSPFLACVGCGVFCDASVFILFY